MKYWMSNVLKHKYWLSNVLQLKDWMSKFLSKKVKFVYLKIWIPFSSMKNKCLKNVNDFTVHKMVSFHLITKHFHDSILFLFFQFFVWAHKQVKGLPWHKNYKHIMMILHDCFTAVILPMIYRYLTFFLVFASQIT